MKIGITGHTSGLGKALYERFVSIGDDVTGMSRSNGYDLSTEQGFKRVVEQAVQQDVFFNNAHCNIAQGALIMRLTNHVPIVTSGSMASDYKRSGAYGSEKNYIERLHKNFKATTDKPMLLLKMGYLESYPDKHPIAYADIIEAISFWLVCPRVSMIEFENHPDIYKAGAL